MVAWAEHPGPHTKRVGRVKPSTSRVGTMDEIQEGFKKKKDKERKLMLRSGTINDCLEAIPHIISVKSMDALIRKGAIEWGCIFTMANGNPTSHMGRLRSNQWRSNEF